MGSEVNSEGPDLGLGDGVDPITFGQILEMDDNEDREFSRALVMDFLDQAKQTRRQLKKAAKEGDLDMLSDRGHFLKGSSATLGLVKVKENCEKIQRYGKNEDLDGSPLLDNNVCLERIKQTLPQLKKDFIDVKKELKKFYGVSTAGPVSDDDSDKEEPKKT